MSRFMGGKFSNEQNIRIRHAPSKRINNMNGLLLYQLELFSLCSTDGIMPDWGALLEDVAYYCKVEMQKVLGEEPRCFRK